MDCQGLVPEFEIDAIELAHSVQPNDMSEVPAPQNIDLRHSGQGNVEHVIAEPGAKYMVVLISGQNGKSFLRNLQDFRD